MMKVSDLCKNLLNKQKDIKVLAAYQWNKHIEVYVNQNPDEINLDSLRLFCVNNIGPNTKEEVQNENIMVDYGDNGFLVFYQFSVGAWLIVSISKKSFPLLNIEMRKLDKPSIEFDLREIEPEELNKSTGLEGVDEEGVDPRLLAAKRLQLSIFPNISNLKVHFSKFFSYYSPEDVLSGDFYWARETDDELYICVADCTGHSVEGALATMTINTLLNQKFNSDLNLFISQIYEELGRTSNSEIMGYSVGVELAIFKLNKTNFKSEIITSGLPVLVLKNGGETEIIKTRGINDPYSSKINLTHKIIDFNSGDRVVMYSDGLADQFDADNRKKLGNSGVKKLFIRINSEFNETKFKEELNKFRGDTEQLDDVTVMAFEV